MSKSARKHRAEQTMFEMKRFMGTSKVNSRHASELTDALGAMQKNISELFKNIGTIEAHIDQIHSARLKRLLRESLILNVNSTRTALDNVSLELACKLAVAANPQALSDIEG